MQRCSLKSVTGLEIAPIAACVAAERPSSSISDCCFEVSNSMYWA